MAIPGARRRFQLELVGEAPWGGSRLPREVLNDCKCSALAAGDHAVAGLDDRGFLCSDFLDRIAQVFLLVEVTVGDDGDAEVGGVGGIQPPTKPALPTEAITPNRH